MVELLLGPYVERVERWLKEDYIDLTTSSTSLSPIYHLSSTSLNTLPSIYHLSFTSLTRNLHLADPRRAWVDVVGGTDTDLLNFPAPILSETPDIDLSPLFQKELA
ncbi:MAG: hypothetical protein ACYS7Y_29875 [Planctomycetota bacterium]